MFFKNFHIDYCICFILIERILVRFLLIRLGEQEGEAVNPEDVRQEAGAQRPGLLPRHRARHPYLLPPRHHHRHGVQLARYNLCFILLNARCPRIICSFFILYFFPG